MEIVITEHAKERMRERHMPPYELQKAARFACLEGDGIYQVESGYVVVDHHTVVSVLEPGMKPKYNGLPVRKI